MRREYGADAIGHVLSGLGKMTQAAVAQSVERVLGKDEVKGPNPLSSSYLYFSNYTLDPMQGE
jgi:hypothetical protein